MKKIFRIVTLLIMVLIVAGCSSTTTSSDSTATTNSADNVSDQNNESSSNNSDTTEESSATSENEETINIKVAEFRDMLWSAAYIADAQGYYDEENINVEFVLFNDGPPALQAMIQGDADFTLLSPEPVFKAKAEGLDSSIVYTALDNRSYGFALGPGVESIQDLKGEQIFAGLPGSAPYSFVSSILSENGLDPQKDVTFLNLDYGAAVAALERGEIKGSYIGADNKSDLEKSGIEYEIVVDTSNPEDSKKYLKSETFPGSIVVVNEEFKNQNPEAVQKYINAFSKATEWINENDSKTVAEALLPYFDSSSVEEITERLDNIKPLMTETGYISEEGYGAVIDFAVETDVVEETIPYEEIIDMQFVDEYQSNK